MPVENKLINVLLKAAKTNAFAAPPFQSKWKSVAKHKGSLWHGRIIDTCPSQVTTEHGASRMSRSVSTIGGQHLILT